MFLDRFFTKPAKPAPRPAVRRPAAAPILNRPSLSAPHEALDSAPAAQPQKTAGAAEAKVVSLNDARAAAARQAPEVAEPVIQPQAPSAINAPAAPATQPEAGSQAQRELRSLEELPEHMGVVSGDGKLAVGDRLRSEMVILKMGNAGEIALIVTHKHYNGPAYLELKERIREARCRIVFEARAHGGLIDSIYGDSRTADDARTDSSLMTALDGIILRAIEVNASDIHVMCRRNGASVKMRRNGGLEPVTTWGAKYASEMARAIHAAADKETKEPTFSESEPQGMMLSRELVGQLIKLRVQTSPAYPDGMDIVMRVLRGGADTRPRPLSDLGYAPDHVEMLDQMMRTPVGLILFAGETGSGKSTSLYTMMTDIARDNDGLKIYTVEDPPEYNMAKFGITQIPVVRKREEKGNPFARTLRTLMRMDPDIAMIGEIRDNDSAEAVVYMVRSGHKIVSTVHASGALGIMDRMRSFNVDAATMTSRGFIAGLVAQRLAPVLCKHCRVDYHPGLNLGAKGLHDRVAAVTDSSDQLFVKGAGCSYCDNTGISTQTVLAEIVIPDGKMLDMLRQERSHEAYEYWRSHRQRGLADINGKMIGMTMLDHGILKMRRGEIAPDELERRVGPLTQGGAEIEALVDNETARLIG